MDFATAAAYRAHLVPYCQQLLGTRADAEDAAQETLLRAWRAWPRMTFESEGQARAWLRRVARNRCIDLLRRRHAWPSIPLLDIYAAPVDVERDVLGEVEMARVVGMLATLPPAEDRLLALAAIGYHETEMGTTLGIPKGTVGSRLHRGRARMRALARAG